MPFTGSHPAAILPIARLGLPLSALVIGSMVADYPYFFPSPFPAEQTHTLPGVLTADLPLGLFCYALWHLLLAEPAMALAPDAMARRVPDAARRGLLARVRFPRMLAGVVGALVLGALTHVLWDSFTHRTMWGPTHLAWLNTTWLGMATFRWLQAASTVLGLAVVGRALARWWRGAPVSAVGSPVDPALRWSVILLLLAIASRAGLRRAQGKFPPESSIEFEDMLVVWTMDFLKALAICMVLGSLLWWAHRLTRPTSPREAAVKRTVR